jgi:hypothetical protein
VILSDVNPTSKNALAVRTISKAARRSWKNVNPNSRGIETLVRILISFLLILQELILDISSIQYFMKF